jgi:hypothetical protein
MDREAAKARERLLQPFGIPKGTSSTQLMETRAIKERRSNVYGDIQNIVTEIEMLKFVLFW